MEVEGTELSDETDASGAYAIADVPVGTYSVTGVSGSDEDLLIFTPASLGETTSGTWELYFDGSDVGLSVSSEDIYGTWLDDNGDIYLTTKGAFTVAGAAVAFTLSVILPLLVYVSTYVPHHVAVSGVLI